MSALELISNNLLSPMVLAFGLGFFAVLIKSDLKLPEGLYQALSVYLLLAIGLKGGVALGKTTFDQILGPLIATGVLSLVTPMLAYLLWRRLGRQDIPNAAALAAHYGSVSAVTFFASISYATAIGKPAEGFMPALVAFLEVPAILLAVLVAGRASGESSIASSASTLFRSKSVVLLLGGITIGLIVGQKKFDLVAPLFLDLFNGALMLFLLEMGMVAAQQAEGLRRNAARTVILGILIPIVNGSLGVVAGSLSGMSTSGSAVLGVMAASASYIAAPAVVRTAIPTASPGTYLGAAIGITFPFNLVIGVPLFFELARLLAPA